MRQATESNGLPEGEEDDDLDGHELAERFLVSHVLVGCKEEVDESCEGERDRDETQCSDPWIGVIDVHVAFDIQVRSAEIENEGND